MPFIRLSVGVSGADAQRVGEQLAELGALAVTWVDAGDDPLLEPAPTGALQPDAWRDARAVGLFALDADLIRVRARLQGYAMDVDFVEDRDWSGSWRRYTAVRRFGTLTIAPRDAEVDAAAAPVLRLDPGRAFGTGSHATTRLCLAWLASLPLAGRSVLDFGCGSGILAIAAKLLGAARVTAVDHDAQALAVTAENAARNGVEVGIESAEAFVADPCFDAVVANILARTLIELAPRLGGSLRPGGRIGLSGVLPDQGDGVVAAYPDIAFDRPRSMEGWVLLGGRRA